MIKIESSKPPVSLITGIGGFCGSHLAQLLLELGHQVVGFEIQGAPLTNVDAIIDQIKLFWVDVRDSIQICRILSEVTPDRIYHLAAINKTNANQDYQELFEINVFGTINLLRCIHDEIPECRVLITGSSAQYGLVQPTENPISEIHPPHPITQYGISKVTQDLVAYCYWATKGLHIVRTRAFNIIGSRQSLSMVGSAFAKQVAEIEQGLREPVIFVGNLETQRDFVDVQDVVRAYQLALEYGESGEVYNICSGQAHSIRSMLELLLSMSTKKGIKIQQDLSLIQSADVPIQVGDYGKFKEKTGWQPEISFEQSLRDLLNYWRERSRIEVQ